MASPWPVWLEAVAPMHHRWNRCQRWAVWLAALPMVLGLSIYGLWRATGCLELVAAGLCTMWVGVVATFVVVALASIGWAFAAEAGATVRQCRAPAALALSLTIASYPAAWFCLQSGVAHLTRFTVTVHNDGDSPWGELRLVGPGLDDSLGTLLPKSTVRRDVWFAGDGQLVLRETTATSVRDHAIDDYVCRRLGGSASVQRGDDGGIRVTPSDHR